MGGVRRFEDLVAWQKARELTRLVYQVTGEGTLARDLGLVSQIRKASVSVMSNIAEGFARSSEREFRRFLSVAHASCAELRSHLYVAFDAGHTDHKSLTRLLAHAEEVARLIGGLRGNMLR